MTKNKLYSTLAIACFLGYLYIGFTLLFESPFSHQHDFGVCIFKNITGYPCPSCGTTRSVKLLFKGEFSDAVMMNPLGLIVAALMLIIPVWLIFDVLTKRQTLYTMYFRSEKVLNTRWIAIILILLLIANWIWNIQKNL